MSQAAKTESVTIVVNTRDVPWDGKFITFEEVVAVAFPGQAYDPAGTVVEVTPTHGAEHELLPGHKEHVKDGMIFDVQPANRS